MSNDTTKKRILIVDDDEGFRVLVSERLQVKGYKVEVAANGLHGIQKMNINSNFQLIITDLKMPGLNGIEMIKKLKTEYSKFDIPIIMLSGSLDAEAVIDAAALKLCHVLVKPISINLLLQKIEAILLTKAA